MWDTSEEPPGSTEGESPGPGAHAKRKCEQNKSQLESLNEIMLKTKPTSKKEEEVQEYARRLSKIKSRAKLSRRNKEGNAQRTDTSEPTSTNTSEEVIEDISQAKTAKAKSTLLQKKLAEDRKAFEQRNKERTETKRAVEEKVEAIRQQLEEKDVSSSDLSMMGAQKDQPVVTPIKPIIITSDIMAPIQIESIREKENKILELHNKILNLEATIVDLQENLKEKDSVIESKTMAVTLMSADLSKKGKTTLDTLEDTKDEMRTMQEHFVLLEESLKNKNDNLLLQLQERDNKIMELEESVNRFEQQVSEQKLAESANADFSRNTMDTLVETKEAMKSMQENFVLIESSLKVKNDNLLQQLKEYELKLAEANERVFKLESGIGIERDPKTSDLQYKLEKLESGNKQLQDEKYELQKIVAELQNRIVNMSGNGNGAIIEKDNRIVELENLVEELKQSNKLLEEESKAELQKQLGDLTLKNEEYGNKITDLENVIHKLEEEKSDIAARLLDESSVKEDEKVSRLSKELEELNKSMIKIKAQHKNKVKNLQKQLENFKKVSDTNEELVRLANQVALLEEEKGNLQLSLVDFDELKASTGDWQERIVDLENVVSTQTKEIQMQIEAIATLENQKLDLMQELHTAKQEISSLEAENAESENLRVTAEMKVVDLEEQLEAVHKLQNESKLESSKTEEKGASDSGSTESFEAIQAIDKIDLLKKIEDLTQKNNELTLKLNKTHEKENSQAGSMESFETIHDVDKNELLKKIDQLTQENTDLTMKLSRVEEKGSSDTGSTESFERIPEHNESLTKIELLTQENNELVIKLTKLEEHLQYIESNQMEWKAGVDLKSKVDTLLEEKNNQSLELSKLTGELTVLVEENDNLRKQIETLIVESSVMQADSSERSKREADFVSQVDLLKEEKTLLEKEVKELHNLLEQSRDATARDLETNELKLKIDELLKENEQVLVKMSELEQSNESLKQNLTDVAREKEELHVQVSQSTDERQELLKKIEELNREKESVTREKQELYEQIHVLSEKSRREISEIPQSDDSRFMQTESMVITSLEREIEESKKLIVEQTDLIEGMKAKLATKEEELEEKAKQLTDYELSRQKVEGLENELKEMFAAIDEWKSKYNEMQEKLERLEVERASIEEKFRTLQSENELLLEEKRAKDVENNSLKQQLQDTTTLYETQLQEKLATISEKENEIASLMDTIQEKDHELQVKYTELQNKMITIDSLQDELNNCKMLLQEKDTRLTSMSNEVTNLNNVIKNKEEEAYALRQEIIQLNEELQESKPMADYSELLQELREKDTILDDLKYRVNATTKENSNLLEQVKSLSQQNNDIQSQLAEKQQELANLITTKERLDTQIEEARNDKSNDEKRIWELQDIVDNNAKFVEDLQTELRSGYKQMEQLKIKHTEDMELQNQRLENLIEEVNAKTQECETLRDELQEREKMIGQNVTEEIKLALEVKVSDLEQKLKDSEDRIQMQLEKMKKIAANLKKKTTVCQELETRVTELEEKWTTEKDEKEAKNKQIQDVEILMREKDNRIADLEEKLLQARNEVTEAFNNADKLSNELTNSKEKMSLFTQQIAELEEESANLRRKVESLSAELSMEKELKESINADCDAYKQQVAQENEHRQTELEEVKEKARELSVRMQVMEAEYVEQLASIKNLKAENGLLLSKQTQINEKLENVEKESEERRLLIEQMQKEVATTVSESTQTSDEETTEDSVKIANAQHCSHCEQCQTLVQALEAKLQEREAEIENLDNELANSIGNFVQMRESLRYNDMMNQTAMRNRSLEDPYNDLLLQYNTLVLSGEEIKAKLEEALKENKELLAKIEGLESANSTLEARVIATEQMSDQNKQNAEELQSDSVNSDLMRKCEAREMELLNIQKEMEIVRERANQLDQELKSEKEQRTEVEKLLQLTKQSWEQEIESLKITDQKTIEDLRTELETYKNQSTEFAENSAIVKREAPTFGVAQNEQDNAPQLFDASKIFGSSFAPESDLLGDTEIKRLQTLLDEKEVQCSNLTQEMNHLQKLMIEERSQISQNYSQRVEELEASRKQLETEQANLKRLEEILADKDKQIELITAELRNLSLHVTEQQNDTNTELKELMSAKNNQIEELRMNLNATKEALDGLILERDQQNGLLESYKMEIGSLEAELKNSSDSELIQELENRISSVTQERDLLQLQMNDLTRSLEELKVSVEGQNLKAKMEKIVRERDEAKELVENLTRALEDAYKVTDKTPTITDTSTKESTPLEESADSRRAPDALETIDKDARQTALSDNAAESIWEEDYIEKFQVDEEAWDWNAEDAQLAGEQVAASLVPSVEAQLRAKVDDLQDQIKDLEKEREKLVEDNKNSQLRSGKMIKKLKEYKVQVESLQQQLKMQKSASDFYDLDSAIEEELKSQIRKLEKALNETNEEQKTALAEKEALTKRLDVVVSANERYMEMKERQDMDMEVLRIRNKELSEKIEVLDKRLQESITDSEGGQIARKESVSNEEAAPSRKNRSGEEDPVDLCKKYEDLIDDLKDEMEALAAENEQLQHFLEEQKIKLSALESKRNADENESIQIVDDLNKKILELQSVLSKSREEYDLLRKQYEQSLMDANDQVSTMRQNVDFLKEEAFEKTSKLEMEIKYLRQQIEAYELTVNELRKNLQEVSEEKAGLEGKLTDLASSSEKQLSFISVSMAEVTDLLNIRIQEVADLKQELQRQYVDHEEAKVQLQASVEQMNQELNEKKQQVDSLKKLLSEKENEFIQQQSVETVSALVSEATQELMQKHAIEIEEKEKEMRHLNEKISSLDAALNEYFIEKQNNIDQFNVQQQELELLRNSLMEKNSILQSLQASTTEQLSEKETKISGNEEIIRQLSIQNQGYLELIQELQRQLNDSERTSTNIQEYVYRIQSLEQELESVKCSLEEKELMLEQYAQEFRDYSTRLESTKTEANELRMELQKGNSLKNELQEKVQQIDKLNFELEATHKILEETKHDLNEKITSLERSNQILNEKQAELDRLTTAEQDQNQKPSSSTIIDGFPLFRMTDDTQDLQHTIDALQATLNAKEEEIQHLNYVLDKNTYPEIIREMQERINGLYNEKAELESSLEVTTLRVEEKEKQIDALKLQIEARNQEFVSKEETNLLSRDRRSTQDQDEIVRLQNELHAKEQEINDFKYIIAEKDSQLSLHASMEPQSDDFELREMAQRLTAELYVKEQELQHLKSTIAELQKEVSRLQEFERLSEETKDAVRKLNLEKEQVQLEAQEFLDRALKEKEMEIDEIKQRLAMESKSILDALQLRDRDIENLRRQLEESVATERRTKDILDQREEEFVQLNAELAEKERRLAELSITKDTELHNLRVQIHEKEVRIEELLVLSDEEEKQLAELKSTLEARETEINSLKKILEDKVKEYELIQNVLKKDVPVVDTSAARSSEAPGEDSKTSTSQELDLALYMLHQRDVRCEELTQELMQLLEERDTLQLRLSNAIRVNEELRKMGNIDPGPTSDEEATSSIMEPLVEHPSPSKSEGPVEIAKEAIDTPIGEDKETLALKLSQLHTVSHAKDVRLRDERELRHTQQMSLLAHKDVLSTLPPEAAARLVNANYTLSRDVQSQSSVLLNWLWGKSTPKVVHM